MNSSTETIAGFCVRDVMRGDLVTVRDKDTMRHAASVLHSYRISGAPVVDDEGRCVGVLSTSDFMNHETDSPSLPPAESLTFDKMFIKKAFTTPEQLETNYVESYMTSDVQTVEPKDSMIKAARLLCDRHIHRLVVVDKQNRPVGIISSLDIVACVVVAFED